MRRRLRLFLTVAIAPLILLIGCGDAEGLVGSTEPPVEEQPPEDAENEGIRPLFPPMVPHPDPGAVEGLVSGGLLPPQPDPDPDDECALDPQSCLEPVPLGPPYPIVLAHGFFGFDGFAGIDFINYFWRVEEFLADAGETLVFVTTVDPFNDSVTRGHQLLRQVEEIVAMTGHERVNLIGHSQGGLDSRLVAHERPDLVASVTTFATPHRGTPVADIALRLMSHDKVQDVIDAIVRLAGAPLWDMVGEETSLVASLRQLSTEGAAEFNALYTNDPEVLYFSLTGRSGMHTGWPHCHIGERPEFIRNHDLFVDPVDPLLFVTQQILAGAFNLRPNDGLVRVEDAIWGRFLGCVPADHLDEIGHLFGAIPGLLNPWRHNRFYVDLVGWLRDEGL